MAVEIYDKQGSQIAVNGEIESKLTHSKDHAEEGNEVKVTFDLELNSQFTASLNGFAKFEHETTLRGGEGDKNNQSKNNLAFAGLKYDTHHIDYGRNYVVIYDVAAYTDELSLFEGDFFFDSDISTTKEASNLLTYRQTDFFNLVKGLNFALQYQGKNSNNDAVQYQNGEGWRASVSYNFSDNLQATMAYFHSKRTQQQPQIRPGKSAEIWAVGFNYDAEPVKFAVLYSESRNIHSHEVDDNVVIFGKVSTIELLTSYNFASGLEPGVAYFYSRADKAVDVVNYLNIFTNYNFNDNFKAYAAYKVNLLRNSQLGNELELARDNVIGIGMTYSF
ncbi:porin [Arsenophonus endosymbiont of Aleurodicus floccissimus]|uniref:porin n=1 Tax=Arsenophonus endosymbiont of Aleurodicus floccissimus TaxID=2152761 RepID=UPI0016042DB7|nr:porin [Arsenophonus endosymbiont of Aleurodicus floccissimus]